MTVSDDIVRFRQVEKSFDGETLVIRDLNLAIRRGEFLTLLGPSGSGKTTILMMLAGFETPTTGEIELDGRPVHRLPPHKRDIGVVFQSYALFPHMTVAQNLAFPLEVRGRKRSEIAPRVERALEIVRLAGFGDRRPHQLSGGQQQRVALARALVFEPKLILMDEPLGALDKQLRERMQVEIKHIHERFGVTVLYVTHDQSEALTMSDRVAVMNHGIIQQLDTPDRIYEAPANAFVAHFIGENNRLLGRIVDVDGDGCRVDVAQVGRMSASVAVPLQSGDWTTLSLRPERVRLGSEAGACENVLEARIEERIYLGDHSRIRLSLGLHDDFIVKVGHAEASLGLSPGSVVTIGFNRGDCLALDRDPSAAAREPLAAAAESFGRQHEE